MTPPHPGKSTSGTPRDPNSGLPNARANTANPDDLPEEFDQFSDEAKRAAADALNGCRQKGGEDCTRLAMAAARRAEGQPPEGMQEARRA